MGCPAGRRLALGRTVPSVIWAQTSLNPAGRSLLPRWSSWCRELTGVCGALSRAGSGSTGRGRREARVSHYPTRPEPSGSRARPARCFTPLAPSDSAAGPGPQPTPVPSRLNRDGTRPFLPKRRPLPGRVTGFSFPSSESGPKHNTAPHAAGRRLPCSHEPCRAVSN